MRRFAGKYSLILLITLLALCVPREGVFSPDAGWAGEKASPREEKYRINFVDVDTPSVVNFISKITGKSFIHDEKLSGKVSIVAPGLLDRDEAFNLFTSVLELKGYSVVFTGTAYKIIPASEIRQSPMEVSEGGVARLSDEFVARLIPLKRISAQEALQMLQPLVSKEGHLAAFGKGNALLAIDSSLNIDKLLGILKLLDIETEGAAPEVAYLKHAQAEVLVQILRQARSQKAGRKDSPQEFAAADKRLNAIVLYGTPDENREMRELISMLDVPAPESTSRINVYYLENADASEIARVLEGILKAGQPAGSPQSDAGPKASVNYDKSTNSLIIMSSPEEYQNILQVVKKLDRRPRQVFVEAMITEVSINKSLDFGAKLRASAMQDGKPVAIGGFGTVDSTAVEDIVNGLTGLTIGGVANFVSIPVTLSDGSTTELTAPGFAALFSLSDFKGVVDVLSTPHILTSDNKEAEIIVGENVPFLSKLERTSASDSDLLQSIERKDVGITLRIKPQISEGDYIKLDIYQEISAISDSSATAADLITTKRSARTSVVVQDRQTVVIGGLIQDRETKNNTKVPLLGDIPILGWLFKSRSTIKEKTNLLVYLTPTIVKEFEGLDNIKKKMQSGFNKARESESEGRGDGDKNGADGGANE